ncbi:MAG: integration host factor [Chloroflexi bacterium]|nr:integration host factor [Chloroflexota bacterium]
MSRDVARELGGTHAQGEAALNAVLSSIQQALAAGDKVVLTGFGSFELRDVKARKVRPIHGSSAGDLIEEPAHKRVGFSAGSELKKAAHQ